MPQRLPITVLIAAKNEEANLCRCLDCTKKAERVVVLDSHSVDTTASIAREQGAEVVQFEYRGGYPKKRQWALETLDIKTGWVLMLDADEYVPEGLWAEMEHAIRKDIGPVAYLVTKGFHFLGRRFRFGGFSHAAVLLFRTDKARFERIVEDPADFLDMEVHERVIVDGPVGTLKTPLIHEDFKGLQAYLDRHNKYSDWEARVRFGFRKTGKWGLESIEPKLFGNVQERRRFLKKIAVNVPFEPQLWFVYHYLLKLGFMEGRRGLIASQIRSFYIAQVRAKTYELQLKQD